MRHPLLSTSVCLSLLALAACGDPDGKPMSGQDSQSPGTDPGADPAQAAGAGEALAGVIRDGSAGEAALTGGITAEARSGDVVLWNEHVRFVVQGVRPGNGIVHTAGNVLDADLVRTDGTLGRDTVEDVFLAFGLSRLFHADTVEVISAGGPGTEAVVVARGTDVLWEYWEGMFERTTPLIADMGLELVTTYTLAPDSRALEISTELTNPGDTPVSVDVADGIFASGEDLLPWAPGAGHRGPATGALDAAWFVGRSGEGVFGLVPSSEPQSVGLLAELASELGIFFAEVDDFELQPGETRTLRRSLVVAPDIAAGEASRHQAAGTTVGSLTGTALEADGTPVPGVRVHFVDATGSVGAVARTDATGAYRAELPPGPWTAHAIAAAPTERVDRPAGAGRLGPFTADVVNDRVLAVLDGSNTATDAFFAAGRSTPAPIDVEVSASSDATADFVFAPASAVRVTVTDSTGDPLPALLDLRWAGDGRPDTGVDADLADALELETGARHAWGWTHTGTMDLAAPPGTYSLVVGHSWRHSRETVAEVVVTEGETTEVEVTLDEVVPRDGWLAMDSHLHASPSFDGALPMEDRLIGCATSGVDLPICTDHDALTRYDTLATALSLDSRLQVVHGLEVTTLGRGHFNLFPLQPAPQTEPNGGVVRWWDIPADTEQLFSWMRATGGADAMVQVNHPRSPGMFGFASFDRTTGLPGAPDKWSWDFELMEVLNGGTTDFDALRSDWFAMLDLGHIRVPTGVSDSHYRYIPCGLARTDVFLDASDPAAVSTSDLLAALDAGHVVIASATTLRAGIDDALPGDTVTGGAHTLDLQVRAPAWVEPGTLHVRVNGVSVHEVALTEADGDGVWLDDTVDVAVDADAWVVVEVAGDTSLGDAWRNATPYALTNAFFIDVDGDGWQPPGLASIAARER